MTFVGRVAGRSLRDNCETFTQEELGAALLLGVESVWVAQAPVHRGLLDTSLGRFSRLVPPGGVPEEDTGHETMYFVWPGITSESSRKSWRKYLGVREVWASDLRDLAPD